MMKGKFIFTILLIGFFFNASHCVAEEEFTGFNQLYENKAVVASNTSQSVRVKDIARFEGARGNVLMGFGLVVGLSGTGDTLRNTLFTQQGLEAFLSRLGVNSNGAGVNLRTKNVAAVTVTATLPPFLSNGHTIDVDVSAMGDATSLEGGMLVATPLLGPNGKTYALAQGSLLMNEVDTGRGSPRTSKTSKTKGTIPGGATVELSTGFSYKDFSEIKLILLNPDAKTSFNIANGINNVFNSNIATSVDPANVIIKIPSVYSGNMMGFLTRIGDVTVSPDNSAKIIINEQTGTIVIGADVQISKSALSQMNLNLTIDDNTAIMNSNDTLQTLVDGLNQMGLTTRDIIDVLHNLHSIGALQAEIIVK
ncbi:MAG: flagella basal body protein [Candidatus Xenolissoclinum pacificiensis L6]|uniref:Flagellar P-ring protein n=1 Tax=Candidatus Xenolissoclinum pacificiensis L6 TaxID=1401685 RepID=W2V0V8_9RICK|nr:MAG: flagella basal body protein [Candidatus Xenolissoclinum pacificiensis L6]